MKAGLLFAVVVVVVGCAVAWFWLEEPSLDFGFGQSASNAVPTTASPEPTEPVKSVESSGASSGETMPPETVGERAASTPEPPASPLARAELALSAAQQRHVKAVADLRAAENAFADVEREIDAVERFVEDLEESGEDPARHAEAGMERLTPILGRFEERLSALESAEADEEAARLMIDQAEAALATLREPGS